MDEKLVSGTPKDGGMLGAGGGCGGRGRGKWDRMVEDGNLVEIVGDVVEWGDAAVYSNNAFQMSCLQWE